MREPTRRDVIKAFLVQERSHCEWGGCDVPGDQCDMHEIVSRGRTVGNDAARVLSFLPQLTSLLCREHHQQAVGAEKALLQANIDRYGLTPVANTYVWILNLLHTERLGLILPESMERAIYGE